jgi:hypothetical protein
MGLHNLSKVFFGTNRGLTSSKPSKRANTQLQLWMLRLSFDNSLLQALRLLLVYLNLPPKVLAASPKKGVVFHLKMDCI